MAAVKRPKRPKRILPKRRVRKGSMTRARGVKKVRTTTIVRT